MSAGIGGAVGNNTTGVANSVNQTENNYLNHIQLQKWGDQLKACGNDNYCKQGINAYYQNLSKQQDARLQNVCITNFNNAQCKAEIANFYAGFSENKTSPFASDYTRIESLGGGNLRANVTMSNDFAFSNTITRGIGNVARVENRPMDAIAADLMNAELWGGGAGRLGTISKAKPTVQQKPAKGLCSFRGDMLVETQNGYKPIADIKIGDMVLAKNEFTGEVSYQRVLNQYNNPYQQTVYVTVKDKNGNSQTIVSNKIHPFFTRITNKDNSTLPPSSEGHNYQGDIKDAQWVDASHLKAGYELLSENGKWQVVQHVEVKDEPLSAYNLTVDNDHTYFIAGNYKVEGVWVHNDCFDKVDFNLNRLPQDIKDAANDTISHINKNTIPENLPANRQKKWGSDFGNRNGDLPSTTANGDKITYKEYDIANNRGGTNAGIDRIVVGSDGRMYYTGTHYGDTGGKPFGRIK